MAAHIYLDHNATAPLLPEVADAIREASLRWGANPGSQHEPGRQARRALEESRERIGELLGARLGGTTPDRVLFTSGGTEANHLALFGMLTDPARPAAEVPRQLVLSAIEHPCIAEPAQRLAERGWRVDQLPVDGNGIARIDQLAAMLGEQTRLVCLMLANNETGVLQPVAEAAALCQQRDVSLHTDAAQAAGKVPVDFAQLGVASLSCAAHKFHGPVGIGVLILKHEVQLRPTMWGGHQQAGLRPGTEMVALACGMKVALESCVRNLQERSRQIAAMRDQLEGLLRSGGAEAVVFGAEAERLPNTTNIGFVGVDRQALAMALDLAEVACSTGSACASGSSEPSPVLVAMGAEERASGGSLRLSLGITNTKAEIAEAARRILRVVKQLRHE